MQDETKAGEKSALLALSAENLVNGSVLFAEKPLAMPIMQLEAH